MKKIILLILVLSSFVLSQTNGSVYFGGSKSTYGFYPNGTNDVFDFGTNPFTMIIRTSRNSSSNANLMYHYATADPRWFLFLNVSQMDWYYRINSSNIRAVLTPENSVVVNSSTWHVLVFTKAADSLRIYEDGDKKVSSDFPVGSQTSINDTYLGYTSSSWDLGYIDDLVVIKGTALSSAQIAEISPTSYYDFSTLSPTEWWKFDEGTGQYAVGSVLGDSIRFGSTAGVDANDLEWSTVVGYSYPVEATTQDKGFKERKKRIERIRR